MAARRWPGVLAALVLVVGAWSFLAPQELGGPMSYVVIYGTSMEPGMVAGDLIAVRESPAYRVGDAVAYYSPKIDQLVLHRIIAIENGRYRFQGDNNDFIDPYEPTRDQLVGKQWFQIGGAGTILKRLQAPMPAAVLAGVVGLMAAGGAGAVGKRRRSRGEEESARGNRPHRPSGRPSPSKVLTGLFAIGLVAFGALAAISFPHADTETATQRIAYSHTVEWSYTADVPPGPVYEDGVATGDPIFTKVVDEVDVAVDYTFATDAASNVDTSGTIAASLRAPNGWSRSFPVTGSSASGGRIEGTIALPPMIRVMEQVEAATEVVQQVYTLELLAELEVAGNVDGTGFEETFDSSLKFNLDPQQMQLQREADAPVAASGEPIATTENGRLALASAVPARVELGRMSLAVEDARVASLIGLGVCFVGLLMAGIPWLRAMRRDEATRIQLKYGSSLIDARTPNLTKARVSVEVETIESLVRLAERFDVPILHHESDQGHRYVVDGGATVYVYAVSADTAVSDTEQFEDESEPDREPVR